ncbi:TPA: restriction endonuclease subunit S [Streptococcus equi subsp. zooepidemicus]|nr:restriction endonuclease subunit S [Streptococcus equi subsp. zooepidemicus]
MFGDPATNSKDLPIATLPDLGKNLDNKRIPITGGDRKAGEYPYYGASGVVDYVADYIFDDDLLLISEDGANLVARVTPIAFPSTGKVWINNHAHVIKFNSMAMQCYVENLLNMMDISPYVTGTAQPKLNQAKLNSIPIPVPEEDQIREYLEFVKQSDKSKFVRFKSQFIEMFGELDKNTKKFPIRKLNEISAYWNGLTYKPADAVEAGNGTLVLRSSNIQDGALAFDDNVFVGCAIKEKLFVQDNDILMCSRNGSAALVGKTALIKGLTEPTTFGAFMMIIRSDYYSYLKTYFETPFFRNQISTGTSTINQITGKMLNEISLPVPDMDTVRLFEEFTHQSDKSK